MLRAAVCSIRAKVDKVYRYLHGLCDVLEKKAQDPHKANPHGLLISESNELLNGLKTLFAESDENERVRLVTIAPKQWGRQKIKKWYVVYPQHIRSPIIFLSDHLSLEIFLLLGLVQDKIRLVGHLF